MDIPLAKPYTDEREIKAVSEVIRSGWFSQGEKVEEFEQMVADYIGVRHCIAVSSGTAALAVALKLVGVRYNDNVICPAFTCMANVNAIFAVGAVPVFVDVDPKTFNISSESVRQNIRFYDDAIMPIHQIGMSADIHAINEIANQHELEIVEDAACALGAKYKGKKVGYWGNPTCFSFHPRKVITTGEGGMIATDDNDYAMRARAIRSHGFSVSDIKRHKSRGTIIPSCNEIGFNYRMTDMQGAMGVEQMKKLPDILALRKKIACYYDERIKGIGGVESPYVPEECTHSYQSYLITLDKKTDRDKLLIEMSKAGISCRHGIKPLYMEPCLKYFEKPCPVAEDLYNRTMFLPIYPDMGEAELSYVMDTLEALV